MENEGISLITATIGRTEQLKHLIETLNSQSYRQFELIVVDQNNDCRLDSIIKNALLSGLDIHHIKSDKIGISYARNLALKKVRYCIIGFPDDDCWYEPQTIQNVITQFNKKTDLNCIVGRWVEYRYIKPLCEYYLSKNEWLKFKDIVAHSITIFCRKSCFEKVGSFNEQFGVGLYIGAGEETELMFRILCNDMNVLFTPDVRVHHQFRTDSLTLQQIRIRQRANGAIYVKQHISLNVIIRGLIAPLVKNRNILSGIFMVIGRIEGMIYAKKIFTSERLQ
jgi:glycosyltransferase involved in cell wall biosynthesis